jgi:hypothetical protein
MDRELEEQIDEIIQKVTKDLKIKISRVVVKHQTKILKDQARDLGCIPSRKGKSTVSQTVKNTGKSTRKDDRKDDRKDKKNSDSDTDGYYSE